MERSAPKSNVQVQGLVTSAADPIIVLLGTSIDRSLIPDSGLRGRYGVIGKSAFFSGLSSGKTVVLRGDHSRRYGRMGIGLPWRLAVRKPAISYLVFLLRRTFLFAPLPFSPIIFQKYV